jgi:hypothetical protein
MYLERILHAWFSQGVLVVRHSPKVCPARMRHHHYDLEQNLDLQRDKTPLDLCSVKLAVEWIHPQSHFHLNPSRVDAGLT